MKIKESNLCEPDEKLDILMRLKSSPQELATRKRWVKRKNCKERATRTIQMRAAEKDMFRGFKIVANFAKRRIAEMYSVQTLIIENGPTHPPGHGDIHLTRGDSLKERSVLKEMRVKVCVIAVNPFIIDLLNPGLFKH